MIARRPIASEGLRVVQWPQPKQEAPHGPQRSLSNSSRACALAAALGAAVRPRRRRPRASSTAARGFVGEEQHGRRRAPARRRGDGQHLAQRRAVRAHDGDATTCSSGRAPGISRPRAPPTPRSGAARSTPTPPASGNTAVGSLRALVTNTTGSAQHRGRATQRARASTPPAARNSGARVATRCFQHRRAPSTPPSGFARSPPTPPAANNAAVGC